MGDIPFFKSKVPIGIYFLAGVFVISACFFIFKGIAWFWAFFYASVILFVGLSFYKDHYVIQLYEDFFTVNFFNPFKKKRIIYYETITRIETEDGLFMKYEYLLGGFISTHDKLIITYIQNDKKSTLNLKIVSEIGFEKMLRKLNEKINR